MPSTYCRASFKQMHWHEHFSVKDEEERHALGLAYTRVFSLQDLKKEFQKLSNPEL
jgi:hypothetical protein